MNKLIIRLLIFFILLFLVLIVILLRDRTPFGKSNSSFALPPGSQITRIDLSDNEKSLLLEKKGDEWFLNGNIETRKSSILYLIKVLEEIKIKSPVSSELFNREIKEKGIEPVKVEVSENNRTIRSFLVYKTGSNTYGNFMKVKQGSKPFIVYLPGYEGEIASAFNMNELYWEPYIVFNLLPSRILSVIFENMINPEHSFSIRKKDGIFYLSDLKNNLSGWDTSRIIRYLTYFTRVSFESWAFDLLTAEKEKIKSSQPLFHIAVYESSGKNIILTIWEKYKEENGIDKVDSDRLWAKTNSNDELFIMRYFDIDPLIKKRSYFFGQ